jgi:hypothetical protein
LALNSDKPKKTSGAKRIDRDSVTELSLPKARTPRASAGAGSKSGGEVPNVIGELLQAHYRQLVDAPVPDHLARLVEMLEQRETSSEPEIKAPDGSSD